MAAWQGRTSTGCGSTTCSGFSTPWPSPGYPHGSKAAGASIALVGQQTRGHRDVDLDIDASQEAEALSVLGRLGYEVETDWRPNRVELAAAGRGWVDLHPLRFDSDGNARQAGANGEFHDFPKSYFTIGELRGRTVRCFSLEAQRRFHTGYPLRLTDLHDLARLAACEPAGASRGQAQEHRSAGISDGGVPGRPTGRDARYPYPRAHWPASAGSGSREKAAPSPSGSRSGSPPTPIV
jgi:lincosamide nucleotidyltransferase A/C/D/E